MSKQGFTLIELIIVIAIMAILMAFATPALIQWRESAQIKEVARDILGGLRQARSIAVTENRLVDATLDPGGHTLSYANITRSFPEHIELEADSTGSFSSSAKTEVTFSPQGTAREEIYIRVNGNNNLIVQIGAAEKASGMAKIK